MTDTQRITGSNVDRLVTTEIRVRSNLPYGVVPELHEAALDEEGEPLSYAAARSLRREIDAGDRVIVATGAGGPPWLPNGETDGPLGAVALARALALCLDARPILTAEERVVPGLTAIARACGFNVVPVEQLGARRDAFAVVSYPETREAGAEAAEELLAEHDPSAVVAVEKGAPNAEGVYHSATGGSMDDVRAKIAPLFERAADDGRLTVGVGDNGNEIGFGRIESETREILPHGDDCECPCGGGVVSRVATDHLVVANASNWGAYGIAAMLGVLLEDAEAVHAPEEEDRMLEAAVREGLSDGVFSRPLPMVDGTTAATQRGIVAMLGNVVENRLTELQREF